MADELRYLSGEAKCLAGETPDQNRFELNAHTGDVISGQFGREVFDLSGMKVPAKMPILMEHDRKMRVGVADTTQFGPTGLLLAGPLLSTKHATEFKTLSKEGFPWQASIGVKIDMKSTEFVKPGKSADVNGYTVDGPIAIHRKSFARETSVVSVGADAGTSARALAEPDGTDGQPVVSTKEVTMSDEKNLLRELRDAFPSRPEFVLEKFDAGQSVAEARAELAAIVAVEKDQKIVELEAAIADLKAQVADKDAKLAKALSAEYGVQFAAAGLTTPKPESKDPWDNDEDLRREFGGDKEVYEAYLRQEADGHVFIQGMNSLAHTN
jgi:hypothetical protein